MKTTFAIGTALLLAATGWAPQGTAQETSESSESYHDNVVIVLDASGSMKQRMRGTKVRKMDAAKDALKAVMKNVSDSTHIGLLVFSAKNISNDWVYPLGPRDDARLVQAIEKPQANRGTPLGEYIKIGADRLLKAREEQYGYGTYRLLVVTDGEANDEHLVDQYAPEVLARGITMDVIGVDMDQDHTLANMAHSYRRANDPDSLEQAIQEVFAELGSEDGDVSMEEAFEMIAPLPIECAAAALQALSTSGNEPIGESSRAQNRNGNGNRQTAQAAQQQSQQSPQVIHHHTERKTSGLLKIGIVVFIALLVLIKKVL